MTFWNKLCFLLKRPATGFSAFELMNGLRKPRTPIEAENLGEVCFKDTAQGGFYVDRSRK